MGLQSQEQSQEQHVRPDKDQLTTDTADLKMTKDALAQDTTAFEDATQDCLVCQTKVVYFEVYTNKNLSEELEALVKAKIVHKCMSLTTLTEADRSRKRLWLSVEQSNA